MIGVMTSGRTWSIAEVADEFGVTHRTVRHYEDLHLISPERRGTQRVFHRRDRTRLGLILRGKRLGFPLEEIRTIIDLYDVPRGRSSQLEYVLGQIDARRTDLEQRRRDLDDALSELDRFEQSCRTDLDRLRGPTRSLDPELGEERPGTEGGLDVPGPLGDDLGPPSVAEGDDGRVVGHHLVDSGPC